MRSVEGAAVQCRLFMIFSLFRPHGKFSPLPLPLSASTPAEFLSSSEHSLSLSLSLRQVFRFFLFLFLGPAFGPVFPPLPYCPTHLSKANPERVPKRDECEGALSPMAFKLTRSVLLSPSASTLTRPSHSFYGHLALLLLPLPFFHSSFHSPRALHSFVNEIELYTSSPFPTSLKCICSCALLSVRPQSSNNNSLLLFADSCLFCDTFSSRSKTKNAEKHLRTKGSVGRGGCHRSPPLIPLEKLSRTRGV